MGVPGQIVILNGAPRAGKSSITAIIQETFDGAWMNLGVDAHVRHMTPSVIGPALACAPAASGPTSSR